jgi:hypothetical protein
MGGVNFFIERVKPYQQAGRNQDEAGSDEIGREMRALLDGHGIEYGTVSGDPSAGALITQAVMLLLEQEAAPHHI